MRILTSCILRSYFVLYSIPRSFKFSVHLLILIPPQKKDLLYIILQNANGFKGSIIHFTDRFFNFEIRRCIVYLI